MAVRGGSDHNTGERHQGASWTATRRNVPAIGGDAPVASEVRPQRRVEAGLDASIYDVLDLFDARGDGGSEQPLSH
jgi:hypothetical protein